MTINWLITVTQVYSSTNRINGMCSNREHQGISKCRIFADRLGKHRLQKKCSMNQDVK